MSDLIDRQAAIDAPVKMVSEGIEWIPVYHLKDLPSAQPQSTMGQINDTAQSTNDCISRQAAIDAILAVTGNSSVRELYEHVQEHGLSEMWSGGVNAAIDIIIAVPSAQPEPSEITDEQAILHLQSTGWMQNHDHEMYESGLREQLADDSDDYDSLIPYEDAVSRQTLQKELALYQIDDITSEDEAGYNRAINDVQKMVLHLPSAQPVLDRTKISDLLEKIYSIQSVHLSTEGVIAKKYYCKQLWMELFGSEDMPTWMD